MEFCYNPGGLILNPERKSKRIFITTRCNKDIISLDTACMSAICSGAVKPNVLFVVIAWLSLTYDSIVSCISLVLNVRYIIITNILRTNITRVCDAASYCFVNEFQRNKILIKQQKKWNNFLALSALVSFLLVGASILVDSEKNIDTQFKEALRGDRVLLQVFTQCFHRIWCHLYDWCQVLKNACN